MAEEVSSVPALAVTAAVGAVVLLLVLLCSVGKRDKKQSEDDSKSDETNNATKSKPEKSEKHGKKTKAGSKPKRSQSIQFLHPWLSTTLKGNSGYILGLDFSPNGKYLINTAEGDLYTSIDTHQMNNSYGAVSPCGRFVASSGFTPDVKVWEVCFDKGGMFQDVKRAFELKGHSAGVFCFSFSNDSSRLPTCGIVDLAFDTTNKYFVSAGDKHIHVFHNITGYRATVADLEEKEKKASGQAMKERIRQQILDAKSSLSSILEQANGHAESK
ncbi:hypothetical protein KUTeg_009865 [Tegillarca granosa]|uniref:Transducin beta-like protein 2 n=1 Tax=Tegillarca granosa TaxID=220873 RepID=A0ABQ9F9D4_TEGGR|nr:hypothetical protein KUTeg_009865 [Tegillarca granosa]